MPKCSVVVWSRSDIKRAAKRLGVDEFELLDEIFEVADDETVSFCLKAPVR